MFTSLVVPVMAFATGAFEVLPIKICPLLNTTSARLLFESMYVTLLGSRLGKLRVPITRESASIKLVFNKSAYPD